MAEYKVFEILQQYFIQYYWWVMSSLWMDYAFALVLAGNDPWKTLLFESEEGAQIFWFPFLLPK